MECPAKSFTESGRRMAYRSSNYLSFEALFSTREVFAPKSLRLKARCRRSMLPIKEVADSIAYPPGPRRSGLIINSMPMAWRPYDNLIDGELDNRIPGKVTGWMRFFRRGQEPLKVVFDLEGDFHDDIRGKVIRLHNAKPTESYDGLGMKTYMKGFADVQSGVAGDITAGRPLGRWTEELSNRLKAELEIFWEEVGLSGEELERRRHEVASKHARKIAAGELYYPYVTYPYIEWYSANGSGRAGVGRFASRSHL